MDYQKVLSDAWDGNGAVPAYVRKRFDKEIVPLLKNALPSDPYIDERIRCLFTDYRLKEAAEILVENAEAGESLVSLVGKVQTVKMLFPVAATFVTGIIAAVVGLSLAFCAGGLASDSWNSYRTAQAKSDAIKAEAEAAYQTERLEFLERVNADLMTCKDGEIIVQKNGKRACFYKETGWFIE